MHQPHQGAPRQGAVPPHFGVLRTMLTQLTQDLFEGPAHARGRKPSEKLHTTSSSASAPGTTVPSLAPSKVPHAPSGNERYMESRGDCDVFDYADSRPSSRDDEET